ncbi:MAG: dockerin type I repeat-containing protein [Clostridia bacterium]|nr:dockerin type I repeat-containing protein [Clostridia bacterium]
MKRCIKVLLSALLVMTVAVSAFAFSSIFSSAQAIPAGVNIAFTGAQNDWVTLSGTTIQDSALKVTISNGSEDTIVISKLENNGTGISYTEWTTNMRLGPGGVTNVGVKGTTNNNAVLKITMTYYVEGNPTATSETASAYIYCSSGQAYSTLQNACGIESGFLRYGVDTTEKFYPVSTGSVAQTGDWTQKPVMTISLYVDRSIYDTWDSLNGNINYKNGTIRDHAFWDKINLSQTSNTGSFAVNGYEVNKDNKTLESTFNNSKDNPEGFFIQVGEDESTDIPLTGQIAQEASSSITIKLRGYGQTGGVFGLASFKTKELTAVWNITLNTYNKEALRLRLKEISNEGLNQASYKSGWATFESALKNAYEVLGTNQVTATQVENALTTVNAAYNGLVRYAVVLTNHVYYEGGNDQNPVQIAKKYEMQVNNHASHPVEVLTNGTYAQYPFNRTNVISEKAIHVDEETNYTDVINQYYWYVDTSALEAAIAAQAAKSNVDEDGNEIYTADSWQNYADEAVTATRILNDTTLFQEDIDAETAALNNAAASLKKLDIDIEWLTEGIEWAYQITENSYDDDFGYGWDTTELFASSYGQELYSNLQSAYNEAVEVTNDPDFTKAQAERVCAALWQAINDLRTVDTKTMGLLRVDGTRHADIDQYGYYKSLKDNHTESNGLREVYNDILDNSFGNYKLHEEDFDPDSWYMLQDALYGDFVQGYFACASTEEPYPVDSDVGELSVPAYSMINNIWFLSSQADYNACRDNLIDKVNNLEWIVDPSALEEAYAEAQNYDLSLYTAKSAADAAEQIAMAEAALEKLSDPQLYGDPEAVTTDVANEMAAELYEALAALTLKPSFVPATEDIEIEPGQDSVIYGEAIGQTVEDAINDLDIVNDSDEIIVKVYDAQDREMALNSKLGTGYKIVLTDEDGDEIYETHYYVIKGDVIGDAKVTDNDFGLVYDYAFNEDCLEGFYLDAADLNGDGVVDLSDAVMIQFMMYD